MTASRNGERGPILIAYDGSAPARAATERAGSLLSPGSAVVICVWTSMLYSAPAALLGAPASVTVAGAEKLDAAARNQAEQLAAEGAERAQHAGLEARSRAIENERSAWQGIVRCADELDAAVIVTGTRGRSGVAAAVLGSTAQGLLHHAHRPVLVVAGG
jgi:nucleotide-binding universal stress UspA family protein